MGSSAAHASLDEYLADWLGLNQSKYQWALNDYYESTGSVTVSGFDLLNIFILKVFVLVDEDLYHFNFQHFFKFWSFL